MLKLIVSHALTNFNAKKDIVLKLGLFIPCYIDQFYPEVGIATLHLLENLGCDVQYPMYQTCCGQPLANSGFESRTTDIQRHFIHSFSGFDYVVCPSASCTHHVRHHFTGTENSPELDLLRNRTLDLVEFLVDVLQISELETSFPHKVGIHESCHGLRGSRMASSSERVEASFSKWHYLLQLIKDIRLTTLERKDECCGFGGTFAVKEAAISAKMGHDRIHDHLSNGAEFITSSDMSCLMHMEGIISRNQWPIKVIHIAQILNAGQ